MAETWPPMIWIGGTQGTGKSTLARWLATAYDLPWHPVDLFTYEHVARLSPSPSLDEEMARGRDAAADAFEEHSKSRLALVVHDVADRLAAPVPAIVEGPQLLPHLATGLPDGWAVWLVASPARNLRVRQGRRDRSGESTAPAHLEQLSHRDAVLTQRIVLSAASGHQQVIEVVDEPDWVELCRRVEAALSPALSTAPRLPAGEPLRRHRRYENEAALRQGRLWQSAIGLAQLPPYPFACECGVSGCAATWLGTPDQYDVAFSNDQVRAPSHEYQS
jgi:hypothetical protein